MANAYASYTTRQQSTETSARDRIAATGARPGDGDGGQLKLLSVIDAAGILAVSKRTVQQLTADRQLAAVRFGRNVRYDLVDLERFAQSHKVREIGWKGDR